MTRYRASAVTRLLVFVLAVAMAGCQANQKSPSTASAARINTYSPAKGQAEFNLLLLQYMAAIEKACPFESSTGLDGIVLGNNLSSRDDCKMQQIRVSLGLIDGSDAACQPQTVVPEVLRCAVMGSAALRTITAAGSEPDEFMNWSDPERSLDIGARLLVTRAVTRCRQTMEVVCLAKEMGTALLLPMAAVDTCAYQVSDDLIVRCLATEMLIDQIRSAMLYVS